MDGLWKKIFVPLFVFKQLGNNAGATKQIQYSLDFFKMSKTKNIQLMPKAILKILKVLALETMSFSHKAINFYMPSSQNVRCSLSSAQQNLFKALFRLDFLWENHWYNDTNNFSLNNINLENAFVIIVAAYWAAKVTV